MRILTIAAVATLALAASPAFAQATSTGTVDVSGSVAGRCLFTLPTEAIALGELSLGGTDGNAGRLDTTKVDTRNATLTGWCNASAATIKVEAQPLLNTALATDAAFTNRVDFTATAAANGVSATDTSSNPAVGAE